MVTNQSLFRLIALSALSTCSATRVEATIDQPKYRVTDLGLLYGSESAGVAINAYGQVAGYANVAGDGAQHAFLWTPTMPNGVSGMMQDLGTVNGGLSHAYGINDRGQVTGISEDVAFLWSPTAPNGTTGLMVALGDPADRFISGQAINDGGQVAGHAFPPEDSSVDAFLWTPAAPNSASGMVHDLGTLGGNYSYAYGINADGQVIGQSGTADGLLRAFLWTPATHGGDFGSMIDLGTLGGMNYSAAWGINASGQVVGEANTTGDAATHAFFYDGALHDLGTLGGKDSAGFGVNASGQVIGFSTTPDDAEHAFLYTIDDGMVDLNALIDSSLGWELNVARGINDAGQITGSGIINGSFHGYLLTPVPEPASLALLVVSLPLVVGNTSRMRRPHRPRTATQS